nr:ribonuclease H-like domain-containing protein [Tanacetum cinerariifolium]
MQKYILKQQFESFSVSNSEGLHKGYDKFQSLLSQLKTHGVGVSTKDANQKFLRSLPSTWSQVSLIMRTKPGVDTLNFDDLYNNLRVFEYDVKGSTRSSSSTLNVAFVSSDNTSSTNEVNTAFDLELVDESDLENMDLKWQVAMISTRLEKFYKKTGIKLHFNAKEPVGIDKSKVECFNYHNTKHFARECRSKRNQDSVDWTGHAKDEIEDYALMAFNSCNLGSDTEKLLAEAEKEKEELKTKLENFQSSSKGLSKLLNSQMSAKDKFGLGYRSQIHDGVLSYENDVFESLFNSWSSDVEDSPVNDRFVKIKGIHAFPPPMTWNYMPPKSDFGIDESKFTYGPKQSTASEPNGKTSDLDPCDSSSSEEKLETVPKPVESKPKVVNKPKVWSDAPIIEEIKAIGIFLALASYMGFIVYQMDVKSAFLYGKIDEKLYVSQPPSFIDPKFPNKVYKVVKALYGLHQAPRAWYATLSTFLKEDGIFISQDKYVPKILKKFDFLSVKTVSTPIETKKPLVKDEEVADVDVDLYRSMIGSLMYLTASRPDIMYAVCACSRFQNIMVTCLEKTEGNSKFHEIVDLLTSNTIHHALTQIHDTVDSKAVVVTKASIRSSLLFNDAESSYDSPLSGGLTSDRAEGALNLEELFSICTNLSNRVLALEYVKDAQATEIIKLNDKIKKLEKKCKTSISLHRAWLKSVQRLSMKKRFGKKESMKENKSKEKGASIKEIEDSSRPTRSILTLKPLPTIDSKDKGKAVLKEPKPTKKMTRSDLDVAQIAKDV